MKAVIPAAGMGVRLRPYTSTLPKGLIELHGKTLLARSLEAMSLCEIEEVIFILGYEGEKIRQAFGSEYAGLRINYVYNQVYSSTGSMYSLYMAAPLLNGDSILVLESDLVYEPKALSMLIDSPLQDAILVTPPLGSGDDVYISYDRDGRITNLGKHIGSEADNLCALVGISKYSPEFLYKLFAKAQRDFAADRKNDHYEECVFATSQMGHPVYILPCEDLRWIEVDTERDLEKARQLILEIFDRTEQSME